MKSRKSLLRLKKRKPLFIVRYVQGHSMMPTFTPGMMVIGLSRGPIRINDIVLFEHNGREKIKRISDIKNGQVYVIGDHPDASTDSRHFGWINHEVIIAKVVWPREPKVRKR